MVCSVICIIIIIIIIINVLIKVTLNEMQGHFTESVVDANREYESIYKS